MNTDFKAHNNFHQVSTRYYLPENELELASLTRYEKIPATVTETADQGAREAARQAAQVISHCVETRGRCVIALGAGRYVLKVYDELVKLYFADKASLAGVVAFELGELGGYEGRTLHQRINDHLYAKVDIEPGNIHPFPSIDDMDDVYGLCKAYERAINEAGGLDLVLCDLNSDGSIAYNEPGTPRASVCRLVLMGDETRTRIADAFQTEVAPRTAITLGISDILRAGRVIGVAWEEDSAAAVASTVEGKMTDQVPASLLQVHSDVMLYADLDSASRLTRISYPWKVTSCQWNDKLIRRAIVWLCGQTGKPVLKLTNKDYNDNGLSELVALYDSAYNVNIKTFNDLQHTITGWPGGKPDADDTHRPERAVPYPKRVLIFSPHPDDAVVSMGGTIKRLVQQGHDVHIAFQTNGDVAVNDDNLMRSVLLADRIMGHFGQQGTLDFITRAMARLGEADPFDDTDADVRYVKGAIMLSEAYMACRHMGLPRKNLHDLSMPFYTDDPIGQGRVGEADVAVIRDLIAEVQPHQIFFDNDLVDPNGTHVRATGAVMRALEELRDEPFMSDCRVWMYRGQWGQWDVDHVQMAVPMSPEEFSDKRDAILLFHSQIHDAPFRSSADGKLPWQRSIERNRSLAEQYQQLGLATYEAIEAFVQYNP